MNELSFIMRLGMEINKTLVKGKSYTKPVRIVITQTYLRLKI